MYQRFYQAIGRTMLSLVGSDPDPIFKHQFQIQLLLKQDPNPISTRSKFYQITALFLLICNDKTWWKSQNDSFFRDAGVRGRVHEVPQAQPPAPHPGCYHVYSVERKFKDFIINIHLSNFFCIIKKRQLFINKNCQI